MVGIVASAAVASGSTFVPYVPQSGTAWVVSLIILVVWYGSLLAIRMEKTQAQTPRRIRTLGLTCGMLIPVVVWVVLGLQHSI